MAGWRLRRVQIEREVWSLAVVMIEVLLKNQLQVALAEDEQPVQSLVAQSLDRTLAVGVGSRPPVSQLTTRTHFSPRLLTRHETAQVRFGDSWR